MNIHTKTLLDYWFRRAGMAAVEGTYVEFNQEATDNPEEFALKLVKECEALNPTFDASQVDSLEFQDALINEFAKLVPESYRHIFLAQVRPN